MKHYFFLALSILFPVSLCSQGIQAYSDNRGYFYAFDGNTTRELEYLPVKSYQAGASVLAYVNSNGHFKIFYNGEVFKAEEDVPPQEYVVTDHLVVYRYNTILKVADGRKVTNLVYYSSSYAAGDSVVAFVDQTMNSFKVYYKGVVTEAENGLSGNPVNGFTAGGNVVAFIGRDNHLKVFYRGKVTEVENNKPSSYQVSMNTIAYVDGYTQTFKVFYEGQVAVLENAPPKSYYVGKDLIAYVDHVGQFRIFYKGSRIEVASFEPDFYKVADHTVVYGDSRSFGVFYKGKSTLLETYAPEKFKSSGNSVAWIDVNKKLKLFTAGEVKEAAVFEQINSYELNRDVLLYNIANNTNRIYYGGKTYY